MVDDKPRRSRREEGVLWSQWDEGARSQSRADGPKDRGGIQGSEVGHGDRDSSRLGRAGD